MEKKLAHTIFSCEKPKAAMFVVHGMQEHRRRYEGFAKAMNARGIAVITYDLPGHGETDQGADRGYLLS